MRTILFFVLLTSASCSFYVLQEFKLPEKSEVTTENGWEIKPYISEQSSVDDYDNRYSCAIILSLFSDLTSGEYRSSDYDVHMDTMHIVLPDTTYTFTSSDCYKVTANNEKKSYVYELKRSMKKDVEKLPLIDKELNTITVRCNILYISKNDSTTQKRLYSFNLIRRNKQGMSSFFLR